MPDGWGLTLEPPGPELAGEIGATPVYLLEDAEADWPALLDIPLVCEDLEPCCASIILQRYETKRQALKARYAKRYGVAESDAFERFLLRVVAGATERRSDEPVAAEEESPGATNRTITLKSYPHCTATVQLRDNGALVFNLFRRDGPGSGHSNTYCVDQNGIASLYNAMAHTTRERPTTPEALLACIDRYFPAWAEAYRWLNDSGVPFSHEINPWP